MKFVTAFIGLILMAQSSFASYSILDGHFKREGDLKLLLAYRVEQVYTITEQGRARLKELKNLGHECRVITSSHYACKSFLDLESIPENIKIRIESKYQNQVVSFGVLRGTPEVINKGEHYTEYLIPQTFSFKGVSKDNYRYFESNEVDKISAGTNIPAEFSFVVESEYELSIVEQTGTNEKFILTMYLVKVPFQKGL